ncbi:hypothetical protein CPSG_03218 [Coccidioides posadasii str. Silveira]|uniref:Uncharacterized protein n=1 Tax=Coccidioides posadasii (strain RMSCC 757 / Silveira) TaxID=443226 RepID=E9D139_COCPS|nr:hypothetical protein CPSG_03218 [Coccidioides posadasii str. Silveira]
MCSKKGTKECPDEESHGRALILVIARRLIVSIRNHRRHSLNLDASAVSVNHRFFSQNHSPSSPIGQREPFPPAGNEHSQESTAGLARCRALELACFATSKTTQLDHRGRSLVCSLSPGLIAENTPPSRCPLLPGRRIRAVEGRTCDYELTRAQLSTERDSYSEGER